MRRKKGRKEDKERKEISIIDWGNVKIKIYVLFLFVLVL